MIYDVQRASVLKRISAFMFDAILVAVLAVGIAFILSIALGYDAQSAKLDALYDKYAEKHSVNFDISSEDYEKLTDEEKQKYEQAVADLSSDDEAIYVYTMVINLTLIITTFSILASYLVLEFMIPLFLKNGQTLGKKIFGIGLMRADGVKIAPMQLFVRSILGKYTLETMVPLFVAGMVVTQILGIVGVIVLLGIVVLEVVVYFKSGTNSLIHDLVAVTVCVDIKSQQIFNTEEELIEYKEKTARENAGKLGFGAESASSVYSSGRTVEIDDEASAKIYSESNDENKVSENIPTLTLSTITIGDETYTTTAAAPEVEREEETSDREEASEVEEIAEETPVEESMDDEPSEAEEDEAEAVADEAEDSEEADEVEEVEETEESETEESEEN